MGRPTGVTDKQPRTRRCKTDEQKAQKKVKRAEKNALAGSMRNFLSSGSIGNATVTGTIMMDKNQEQSIELMDTEKNGGGGRGDQQEIVAPPACVVFPEEREDVYFDAIEFEDDSIIASYDTTVDNNDGDADDTTAAASDAESDEGAVAMEIEKMISANGPMQDYLRALHSQLKFECHTRMALSDKSWLLKLLRQHDWKIPANLALFACKKLGLTPSEPSYYRDVVVWLPDLRWNEQPPCPNCGHGCQAHGWRDNHFGRLVVNFYSHYYMISRRYICAKCKAISKDDDGCKNLSAEESNRRPYTFTAWNRKSIDQLPDNLSMYFPAYLTHRCGVDKTLLDFMRPLFSSGVRPKQFRDMLLELSTKHHHREWLKREHMIDRKRRQTMFPADKSSQSSPMYSRFNDKTQYNGYVPSAAYLSHVFKLHQAELAPLFETEVKKREATMLRWDVSYKEAKLLCRYHGKPMFRGLVTATNQIGEVRIQFHVVTDGHDQMVNSLSAFRDTVYQYGQKPVQFLWTDKPRDDYAFMREHLPSLVAVESALNLSPKTTVFPDSIGMPLCDMSVDDIMVVESTEEIDIVFGALDDRFRKTPGVKRIIGLDEEHEYGSTVKFPPDGRDRVALIQIAYRTEDNVIKAILVRTHKRLKRRTRPEQLVALPKSFLRFLSNEDLIFVGVRVTGDIKHIGDDFNISEVTNRMVSYELGSIARDKGVVPTAIVGLQMLVRIVLGEHMSKEDTVRSSAWASSSGLTEEQTKYAALDPVKSLEVYLKMVPLLNKRALLSSREAKDGVATDIVAPRGKVFEGGMGIVAAIGTIVEYRAWEPKTSLKIRRMRGRQRRETRVVEIQQVMAPGLIVPGFKIAVGNSTNRRGTERDAKLGDFATALPFLLELPLTMLKHHDELATKDVGELRMADCCSKAGSSKGARWSGLGNVAGWNTQSEYSVEDTVAGNIEEDNSSQTELSSSEIAEIKLCVAATQQMRSEGLEVGIFLDPPPREITDLYRSCLGDPWHLQDRPKTSVRHAFKKAYYAAFREALYVWDSVVMETVKKVLKKTGMTEKQVEAKLYYDSDFFCACCPRAILPPSIVYWRVRAVFATFGNKVDSGSAGVPLFNELAWKKANNVLKDILKGYYSDPPGVPLYKFDTTPDGEIIRNAYGLPTYRCERGTNHTETHHKQMLQSIGTTSMGVEMSDYIRAEHRHRYNQRVSERRRPNFCSMGHYDTWLVCALQIIVERNHNKFVYPYHANTLDFAPTEEKLGTTALQHGELTELVNNLDIVPKLTREQKYLANCQGVKICFAPFAFQEEKALFAKLVLENQNNLQDERSMALAMIPFVNGETIFPKLDVYIRNYRDTYRRNKRIEDAVGGIADSIKRLDLLNRETAPVSFVDDADMQSATPQLFAQKLTPQKTALEYAEQQDCHVDVQNEDGGCAGETICPILRNSGDISSATVEEQRVVTVSHRQKPILPPVCIPVTVPILPRPTNRQGRTIAGLQIGVIARERTTTTKEKKRRIGERGLDKGKRRPRTCRRCRLFQGTSYKTCRGKDAGEKTATTSTQTENHWRDCKSRSGSSVLYSLPEKISKHGNGVSIFKLS